MHDDRSDLAMAAAAEAAAEESGRSGPPDGTETRVKVRNYGLTALVVLFVLNLIDEFDRAVLAVALDEIREHFGVSDGVAGLLPAAVIFIMGLLAVPIGNLADHRSRKAILGTGALVWGTAGLFAAGAQSFLQLFLTRALLGSGQATIAPTHFSLLSDLYPAKVRGRVLGYHRAANPAGQVLGAVIGGAVVGLAGWRWGFLAAAVPGLIVAVVALLVLREPVRGEADLNEVNGGDTDPLLAAFLREPAVRPTLRGSVGRIWANMTLRYLILANAALGFGLFGALFFLPTFVERSFGFSVEESGLVLGVVALGAFIGTWFGGPIADRNLHKGFGYLCRVGVAGLALVAVCFPLAFAVAWAPVTIPLLAIGALVGSLAVPGVVAVVAAAAPPDIRSQAFSCFGLALSVLGAASAPVLIGVLSDMLQSAGWSPAHSLQAALFGLVLVVMTIGTALVAMASRHADGDVARTIEAFLARWQGT